MDIGLYVKQKPNFEMFQQCVHVEKGEVIFVVYVATLLVSSSEYTTLSVWVISK
jgi:hypothetical protein